MNRTQSTRQIFRKKLREGALDDKEIEIELSQSPAGVEIMAPPGMEEMTSQLQNMFSSMGKGKTAPAKLTVAEALKHLKEEEAAKLINEEEIKAAAVKLPSKMALSFSTRSTRSVAAVKPVVPMSPEKVCSAICCRLIEGSTVSTKYGMIKTDHILFIASGAFHLAKPSDLIPELQGRLPIRVELNSSQDQ